MQDKNFHQLFILQLKDIYSAEEQLLKALPKMAEKAQTDSLRQALEDHHKQTEEHVKRLEEIAETMDFWPGGHHCLGMKGLIEEGNELLKLELEPHTFDAGIVSSSQEIEHYEMSGYLTAVGMARQMGHDNAAELLSKTLEEEMDTDEKLRNMAENEIGPKAIEAMEKAGTIS